MWYTVHQVSHQIFNSSQEERWQTRTAFSTILFERFLGAYSPQYVFSEFVRSRGPTSFYNQGIEKGPECLRVRNSYVKMVENVTWVAGDFVVEGAREPRKWGQIHMEIRRSLSLTTLAPALACMHFSKTATGYAYIGSAWCFQGVSNFCCLLNCWLSLLCPFSLITMY